MDLLDAIDTLLICLLSRQQMTAALMAFVRQPNHADVAIVEANLKASGDLNALAFLYANSGRPHQALEIWKVGYNHRPFSLSSRFSDIRPLFVCWHSGLTRRAHTVNSLESWDL